MTEKEKKNNTLAIARPDLAAEWHPTKNGDLTPDNVTTGSGKKVWWRCKLGHEWQAAVYCRTSGTGCPLCSGLQPIVGQNDLATTHPDLAAEWHPTKNGDLTPADVTLGSNKKVWWQCSQGHEWESKVNNRAIKGNQCPFCSGRRALVGVNDLSTSHPDLAKEWHPTKNGNLKPENVSAGSGKKVWWRCKFGHEWQAAVYCRTKGTGCPFCSGRQPIVGQNDLATTHPELVREWHPTKNGALTPDAVATYSEKKVWWICEHGHEWRTSVKNRTSSSSGCPFCSGRLVTKGRNDLLTVYPEIAKEWHPTKNSTLTPDAVTSCSMKKAWWICAHGHEWQTGIDCRAKGSGCPVCAGRQILIGFNDLASVQPELAKEWHPTKNGTLTAQMVTAGSHKEVWWLCQHGHEWKAQILNRTNGQGCPFCSGHRVLVGFNDLATKFPDLVREWHPTKNGGLTPQAVSAGSEQKVWWICKHGHEWQACVSHRTNGNGCPFCSGKRVLAGYNDLYSTYPEVAKEWHPSKNGELTPQMVVAHSHKKVWWKCERGHEWQATINSRVRGCGCPVCRESKGEKKISKVLEELCVSYSRQLRFDNCRDELALPFDIGVFENDRLVALIEYDGKQHYVPVFGERELKCTQRHDKMKDDYCKIREIPLLRIHYTQFDNIEKLVKEFLAELKLLPREKPAA